MKLTIRKLLAPATVGALAACGHTPASRVVAQPVPVTEAVSNVAPATAPTTEAAPAPAPAVATPMCDAHGRPLAGNVRTKAPQVECARPRP